MNVSPFTVNMTQIETDNYLVLFSYRTAAAYIDKQTGEAYRTDRYWSQTTTRHINKWFKDMGYGHAPVQISQKLLDGLI
jgi:hypothetical protein